MAPRKDSKFHRKETPLRKRTPNGDITVIDINDVEFLKRYVSEQGKILPQRMTARRSKRRTGKPFSRGCVKRRNTLPPPARRR